MVHTELGPQPVPQQPDTRADQRTDDAYESKSTWHEVREQQDVQLPRSPTNLQAVEDTNGGNTARYINPPFCHIELFYFIEY